MQYCIQYCKQYRTSAISCFCVAMLAGEFGNRKSPIFCFCPKGKGIIVSRARCCSHAVSARNPRPSKQKQKIGDFLFLSLLANKSPRKQEIADVLYCTILVRQVPAPLGERISGSLGHPRYLDTGRCKHTFFLTK